MPIEPEEAFYTQPREDPFGGFMQVSRPNQLTSPWIWV